MYTSNNVSERIKQLCKSKNVPVKKMLGDVNLGLNTMSNMKNSMPKADNLAKIADYLNCSVDYLLGRTADPALENRFPDLTDEEWTKVEAFVTGLIANRR